MHSTVTTAGRKLVHIQLNCRFSFVLLACGHTGLMCHQLYGKNTTALEEILYEGVDWIHVAQDRKEWGAL